MPCYRTGGCGPYEGLSCTECPASHPEYLQSRDHNVRMAGIQVAATGALTAHKELHRCLEAANKAAVVRDADTVLADLMGIQGDQDFTETGEALLTQLAQEPTDSALKMFHTLTGVDVEEYCKTVADTCNEQIAAFVGKDPRGTLYEVTVTASLTVRVWDKGDENAVESRFSVAGDQYAKTKDALQASVVRGNFDVTDVSPVDDE